MTTESPFTLTDTEVIQAVDMYAELGEKTADGYQHLSLNLKRAAASVVIGVVRRLTPEQLSYWSADQEFRAGADALIMAYEITHPDKLGAAATAGDFITDLARRLNHNACPHHTADTELDAKFNDIMAGFEVGTGHDGTADG